MRWNSYLEILNSKSNSKPIIDYFIDFPNDEWSTPLGQNDGLDFFENPPCLICCTNNSIAHPLLAMELAVAILDSARISTGSRLLKLVVVTLGKIPHQGGAKLLCL